MTPKEKAIDLYGKYYNRLEHKLSEEYSPHEKDVVKECVLVAVDEIIQHIETSYHNEDIIKGSKLYWQQVKDEINHNIYESKNNS
jgi:hypothetical protein